MSLPRVLAVPTAALVVLVTAPGLVVKTITPSSSPGLVVASVTAKKQAAKPAVPEATLAVALTGADGTSSHPYYLHLAASGEPPPPKRVDRLADSGGLHAATVRRAAAARCDKEPLRQTLNGSTPWCLVVQNVAAGHALTGVVLGGTKLTLSVTRRDGDVLAAVILALGLGAAFFVTWFAKGLERLVSGLRLADLLDRNARAQANKIDDLDTWVDGKLEAGDAAAAVLAALGKLPPNGARAVREARLELAAALTGSGIPADAAYREPAQAEAVRPDVDVVDLLDDDGKAKPVRAQQLLEGLKQLSADVKLLGDLETSVNVHLVEACRETPLEKIVEAQTAMKNIDSPERVGELTQPLTAAQAAYAVATKRSGCLAVEAGVSRAANDTAVGEYIRASGVDLGVADLVGRFTGAAEGELSELFEHVRALPRPALPRPAQLRGKRLRRETQLGKALTGLAIAAVVAFTVLTVWQAAYASKPDFAGFADYFALFSAALASGAAASVLGILAYWRPQPAAA